MSDDDFIKFRRPGETSDRIEIYQLALDLSAALYTVIELAEMERYFLRDSLDKKSTAIPIAINQGLGTADMVERRAQYTKARKAARECMVVLDVLAQRGTVEPEVLAKAHDAAALLVAKLEPLTIPPPQIR